MRWNRHEWATRATGSTSSPVRAPGDNPVHDFLDQIGVPWRTDLRDLVQQFGVSRDEAYQWDVVNVPLPVDPVPGMMSPFHVDLHRKPRAFPPDYFTTRVWVSEDPMTNFRIAADALMSRLGEVSVRRETGIVSCAWRAGPASVTVSASLPEERSTVHRVINPAHDRDPRLRTACHVGVRTGYRRELTAQEYAWVRNAAIALEPTNRPAPFGVADMLRNPPMPPTTEFARDAVPECSRLLGSVAVPWGGAALIICGREFLVIPRNRVLRVSVSKLYPAKGPGGSSMYLVFSAPASEYEESSYPLRRGDKPDDLDSVARAFARRIGVQAEIGEAFPDC